MKPIPCDLRNAVAVAARVVDEQLRGLRLQPPAVRLVAARRQHRDFLDRAEQLLALRRQRQRPLARPGAAWTFGIGSSTSNFSFSPGGTAWTVELSATGRPSSTSFQVKVKRIGKARVIEDAHGAFGLLAGGKVKSHCRTSTARGAHSLYCEPSASDGCWQKSHAAIPNQR